MGSDFRFTNLKLIDINSIKIKITMKERIFYPPEILDPNPLIEGKKIYFLKQHIYLQEENI